MSLKIKTFSNQFGGNAFYKAVTHPFAASKAYELLLALKGARDLVVYDPLGQLESFAEFFPLDDITFNALFVQDAEKIGQNWNSLKARGIHELKDIVCQNIFIAAFDGTRLVDQIKPYLAKGCTLYSLDAMRLPDAMITDKRNYLANLNFATNFAFFRDDQKHHTRLVTTNYWGTYGSSCPRLWCCLMDGSGKEIVQWFETLPGPGASVILDSSEIRQRFDLSAFTGQLFVHVVGAAGHDIVKYALDTYGDTDTLLSCTHDANAWPCDQFAGLPAPTEDETVILWLQNSHPRTILQGEVGLNLMGKDKVAWLDRSIAPFETVKIDVSSLLPEARWPQQIEIQAGKNFVRPRYEITIKSNGRMRIAHPNVERDDLAPDAKLPEMAKIFGKFFILPAPILPLDRYISQALPTPMAKSQKHLPLKAQFYDARGKLVLEYALGNLKRHDSVALCANDLLADIKLESGYGHMELSYNFTSGTEADGWLHGLFRYSDRLSGHAAETSFGAHIFNTGLTYKSEPQSYAGRPPGLTTRLFLRVGPDPLDTLCHLIYPASLPWHATSDTSVILMSMTGQEIVSKNIRIACGGSWLWRVRELFSQEHFQKAGAYPYIVIRDTTCRLFGYHGLVQGNASFSLDHMFGF